MFDLQKIKGAALEEVFRQMPAAVIVVEAPSGKIILRNGQAQQIREQSLSQARASKLEDAGAFQIYHPDGRPYEVEEWPLMRSIRDGEEVRDEEIVYPLVDGTELLLRCDSSPIYDEEGRIVAGVLIAHDITEQKQSEEKLRRSEERFRLLVEGVRDYAIFMLDPTGRIQSWNEGARRIKGYSQDEILGEHFSIFYPPEDVERVKPEGELREAEARGVYEEEGWRVRKDGSRFWASVLITALRDEAGQLRGFAKVTRDITERKRADEEIERRTQQQAAVVELGLSALAKGDLQSLMDQAATSVAQTLGVEYAKIVELLPSGEELLLRAGVGWEEGLVGSATEGVGLDSQAGYTLLVGDPVILEDLSTERRFRPSWLVRDHGAVSGMSVVIYGREEPFGVLSAYTREHGTFSEDDVDFMQAVANVLATAIEREEAQERVEEVREAERSRIARDLHDDALQNLADALVQTQHLQSSSENPQQSLRLVHLLATLDRIGPQLRGAIYDLRLEGEHDKHFPELLASLVELHRTMAPQSNIALEVHNGVLSGPLGERGRQLLRIIGEALTNTRRHSGARNVRVSVGIIEEKLWAEVQDDGRGFDVAEGIEQALSARGGLGIRSMRERARALGGDLKIESDPQRRGTRVRFEMPLEKVREKPEEGERSEGQEVVRILLVEDHATLREALASTLDREAGFEVAGQASSLQEARRIFEAEQPVDVAVVDLALPDGYGGDLIKDLRQINPHAQALVLSASLDRAQIARAIEAGAAGVLNKSAHLNEVVDAIRRLRAGQTLMPLEEVVQMLRYASSRREEDYEARRAIERLTPREIEVLQALAEGLDGEGIAERLSISLRTERNHMANILSKLGVHSQLQALVFALRYGVVDLEIP